MGTQRTLAALDVLLADNTTGDIGAGDIRDLVETLRAGHGEIAITSVLETVINTIDVYEPVNGTYTLSGNAHNWDMNTNGQLRYIGVAARVVHIASSVSFTTAGNLKLVKIRIAKNGTPIAVTEVQRHVSTGADVGSTALHGFIDVVTNDYISLEIANATDDTNITMETLNLFGMDVAA